MSLLLLAGCQAGPEDADAQGAGPTADSEQLPGFIDLYWQEETGELLLRVKDVAEPFLYVSWLARGVGSNDLGLDRGQMGDTRLVRFQRHGPRLLLVQQNEGFRSSSLEAAERRAVTESFAVSVLGSFDILAESSDGLLLDPGDFFFQDVHKLAARLRRAGEGSYTLAMDRSALYREAIRSFPDNTEVEAIITFTGDPEGEFLPTVVPDPASISVHLHHSFVRLPDDGFEPLPYEPRSGYLQPDSYANYRDYSTALSEPVSVAYTPRHRLRKKNPAADRSEAVEPIVYYLDRGVPEPVRGALLDGARWWNQAFEAAGYDNAFRVELLPEGADPLDVRYNVIQWVHRATRGWSYGYSVVDPRTGEIIKGHVSLGSLRVRQDYLLAEGLLAPYANGKTPPELEQFSLARIRQLSAHEVGHTLGLEHNFAGSADNRSSVMDYPFPLVTLNESNTPDLGQAYAVGIGDWDKRAILYGYQDFPETVDAGAARAAILRDTLASGLRFVANADARDPGTAHPLGSLWDNGENAIDELARLIGLRRVVLNRFSTAVIAPGRPLASLEKALVPMYLLHRYQVQAAAKHVGGEYFSYAFPGDGQQPRRRVSPVEQHRAIETLLTTLRPDFLALSPELQALLPPPVPAAGDDRELFPAYTNHSFDAVAAAQTSVNLTLEALLHPARAARLDRHHAQDSASPSFSDLTAELLQASWYAKRPTTGTHQELQRMLNMRVLESLLSLSADGEISAQTRGTALDALLTLKDDLADDTEADPQWRAHYRLARYRIDQLLEAGVENPPDGGGLPGPPGSPIGQRHE